MADDAFIEAFMEAFCTYGGPSVECGFCGRTNYASDPYINDESDTKLLAEYRALSKKDPDKYICHEGCNAVSHGDLNGRQMVYGCPCTIKNAGKYAVFVWDHRFEILQFLTKHGSVELAAERLLDDGVKKAKAVL